MAGIVVVVGASPAETKSSLNAALGASSHRGTLRATERVNGAVVAAHGNDDGTMAEVGRRDGWVAALHGTVDNRHTLSSDSHPRSVDAVLSVLADNGVEGVEGLRGSFAFAATDGRRVIAARDHMGSKPLHYGSDAKVTVVATEAKAVVDGRGLTREPDLKSVERTFYRGTSADSSLQGAARLPGASTLVLDPDRAPDISRHWNPEVETISISVADAIDRLDELLAEVLARQVTGHDCVSLSGGLDSTAVAAYAVGPLQDRGQQLQAYTVVYPDHATVDESSYTELVADRLGIPLVKMQHSAVPLDDIEHWVKLADGPWDTLPAAMVHEAYTTARASGSNTVMTGDLAEYLMTMRSGLLGHLLLRGRWSALSRHLRLRRASGRSWQGLARQVGRDVVPGTIGRTYSRLTNRTSDYIPRWIDGESMGFAKYRSDIITPARHRWTNAQLSVTRGTNSASEVDELVADISGVTVRRPLADRDLWDFFLSLPAEVKFPDERFKALLREATRDRLPVEIVDRPDKTAFDEFTQDSAPYEALRRLIRPGNFSMPNVNYEWLQDELEKESLPLMELSWAKNLARAHAFVDTFE